MMKKFTSVFLTVLFAVLTQATYAQKSATTSHLGDVDPVIQASVKNTLRATTNMIWFEKNAGQFNNPDVLYGFRTAFGSMGVYNNKIRIVTNQKEWDEQENEAEEAQKGMPLQIVDLTFPGSNGKWTVEPGSVSSVMGTYYRTTEKNEKGIRPVIYNEITLKNVYPGIDLRLYSGQSGAMEFDWIVSKAADYSKIKMQLTGQDDLLIEKEGNLTIKMHENNMTLVIPETFQTIGGSKKQYKTSMVKVSDNTLAYQVEAGFDPAQPLVIDPVMMWSTYMHNGSSTFDEYLYSIASNSAGEVYCAGFTNEAMSVTYLNNVSAGYSSTFSANPSTVLYKLNATGTNILAWTMTGVSGASNFPSDLDIFPDGRILLAYTEDVVQIFSATLAARSYSGSISSAVPANANSNVVYQSVVAIDNNTFYVSGSCTSAFSNSIISGSAPDNTFAGSSEGFIIRVTGASGASLTANWGTYVGGNNNETFASIACSTDKTKLAFAVHTVVGSSYPTLVNAVDNTIAGTTEILVGSLTISSTPQTAFTAFSYLGGSSSEGLASYSAISGGPQGADKAVVCADNNYFYVGYNSSSTDIPGTTGAVQTTNKGAMDQVLARIPWNGSAGTGFVETYNGGSSDDLVGGIAVDFRSSNVLLFGTTTSSDYPANNTTPASPYYQSSFGGFIDISYASFSNNLAVRTYGTFIGGTEKDYMGSTGILRGSGHLFYNNTNGLTYIGTTIHSDQSTVPAQWITNVPGFDKAIPPQTGSKDNHFIFEWNSNTFDYGDAPTGYDGSNPAHSALTDKVRLGLTIDAETGALSSTLANGDDLSNTGAPDDEDGVAVIPTATTGATTYSVSVSVLNNTGATINLRGWIDANANGAFDASESALVSVPTSASQQTVTLSFTGLPVFVYGTGNTFLRIRIADATLNNTDAQGEIGAGEVEDYQVCIKPNAGPDQQVCIVGTATMAASGTGTWSARAGNPGSATIASSSNPTTTISGFSTTGTYGFVWTNPTGCTDTVLIVVTTQPGAVTITPANANICIGSSITLTASASPSGGTYQWSPLSNITPSAGNTASVSVNPATTQTYNVVYSLSGCTSSASRQVTVYPVVSADAGPNQTYCSNVSTTITLGGSPTAAGGSGNFTYAWSPPTRLSSTSAANPTITSVVSGTTTYYVTVTDNVTGCTSVDSMTLIINPAVTVSIALSDTDICLGQVTTLAATGTPAGGTYTWSPTVGMTPSAGNTASVDVAPSANQTYTVLYSLGGCTNTATRKVNVYPTVGADAGADQTYCLPVSTTITLGGSPTATSGSGSYTYTWSPTTRLSNASVANPTVTSAVASNIEYYVTVTDNKSGCTAVDSMRLIINSQATVSISSADTNLCAGQSTTLTATGLPAGGTYSWSPTNFMTPVAGNTATVTVAPPANQTYQVTYTASGCIGTATKTVNVVPAVVAHAGGNQTYCMPYAGTVTLGATPTATGGSGNFSYLWSPSTRLSSTTAANPTLTSNVASTITYYVTVTDNVSGCTSVDSAVITLNPAVVANAGSSTSVCNGLGVTLGGSPTGSGGTGTLSYSWSPTAGLSSSTVANPVASPTVLTTYTVTVTDTKSCSATSSVTVKVNTTPTADAGPTQFLTACSAASVTIGGTPTASGGTPGYTYLWSPAGGLSSATDPNPTVSQIGSNATYTVTVTDSKGCTATASVKVNVTGSTLQVDAGVNVSYCANSGSSTTLTGTVSGGTGPYTYQWSPATGLSATTSLSTVANPSAAGSYLYTINVTDFNGCNASDTVRLDVWPAVVASAGAPVSICNGSSVTIGGAPTASGGTAPFVYAWAPGTGLNSTAIANPVADPTNNTTYNVTVTDAHSCSATSSVLVTVNSNPVAHAGTNQTYCLPITSTITLGATPTATGGTGTYTYTWSPTSGLSTSTGANPTVSVSGASSTKYYVTVTDGNGCFGVDSTILTILAQPSVTVTAADTDICTGQTTTLTGVGSPAGGTYQWYPLVNITPSTGNTASVDVNPTANQTYFVVYTQGSCSDTAAKTVRVYSTVLASAGPNQTYCLPVASTITLGGVPSASGGSGSYAYAWSPSGNLSSATVANPTLTSVVAGTTLYSLTVTDKVTGCQSVSTMTLTINPTATVTIAPADTDLCTGQSTTLTAIGSPAGGSYQWSPTFNMNPGAGNTATVTVAPSGSQRYQVTYTANGCSGSTAVTVNVYPRVVAHAGLDQAFCLPYSGNIFLGSSSAATGGSGSYSYQWAPTANLSDSTAPNPIVAKVNTNTEYYLTVTDNVTGCTSVDSSRLIIDTHATLVINSSDTDLCFGQTTVLTAVANPLGGTYQWVPIVYLFPGTGNTASVTVGPITSQLYQLVYTRNGCRDTAYKQVNVYPTVVADAGADRTFCLPHSGSVVIGGSPTAAGGSGAFSYTWSPSTNLNDTAASNPVLTSLVAGTYKYYVTVTDNKSGCTSTDSVVLTISPSVAVTATASQYNICGGGTSTLTATGTPAGGNYQWNPIIAMNPANGNSAVVNVTPNPGTQTYFVYYDLNGCRDTSSVTINTYTQPVVDAGVDQSYCLPVTSPIRVGNTATGGSGNYSYHWSPAANVNDSTIARPRVTQVTTAGATTYTVTVTDLITGCIAIDSARITLNTKPTIVITSPDTNLCFGQSTTLTATASPAGGNYQWTPTGNITPVAGNTPTVTFTPTGIGNYSFRVIYGDLTSFITNDGDTTVVATGCYDTAYQTVHVYTTPVAHAGGNKAYCMPVSGTIALGDTPTATGGSGRYLYTWTPSTGLSDSTVAHPLVNSSAPLNVVYHLTVTDTVSGCTATDSARIIINPQSTVSISSADTDLCQGQNTTLTAVGAPPGGTYLWSGPFITPASANTASISVAPTGTQTYTVVYTLSNCSATAYKTVRVFSSPVAHAGPNKSFCPPTTSVQIGQTATGGSGSYTYVWASSPAGFASTSATPTVTPTAATTTYYVTVTDAISGCTGVDSVVVIKRSAPPVDAGDDKGICAGGSTQLIATGALTYQWTPTGGSMLPSNGTSQTVTVAPATATTYTVVGTDIYGCTASDTVRVSISPNLVVFVPSVVMCQGDTAGLRVNLTGPNYRYQWSPTVGITCNTCAYPLVSPATINNFYTVTVTDTITGCTGTYTDTVTAHVRPQSHFVADIVCAGDTVGFHDQSSSSDGAITGWFYNFGDTSTLADTSHLQNPTYTYPYYASSYDAYQMVTTAYGCSDTSHFQVTAHPPVIPTAGPDTVIGQGSSVVLSATGGTSYVWSPATGLSTPTSSNPVATPTVTTTYYVTVTNSYGCIGKDSVHVVVVLAPDVTAGPDTFVCTGSPMLLRGFSKVSGATYQWYSIPPLYIDSLTHAQPTAVPQFPGIYTVVLKVTYFRNGIYVSAYDTMLLTANPVPVITANPDSSSVCSGTAYHINFSSSLPSTTITWTASNGTSGTGNVPNTTVINNGTTDSAIYYTVIGTEPGGCSDTVTVPIVVKPIPTLTKSGFAAEICSGNTFTGTVTSNIPGAAITWTSTLGTGTGGTISQILNNPNPTPLTVIYAFTATYNSCASQVLYDTVVVNPLPRADAGPDQTIAACSTDSIQLGGAPTATGGTPGYTYLWSPPTALAGYTTSANPYVKHLGANTTYTVTVTDAKGCTATDQVAVRVTPATLAISVSTNGPTTWCEGSGGSVDLTVNVTGGTAGYTYLWTPTAFLSDTNTQVTTASPNAAGSYPYTILVTDASGCQASASKTIVVKPLPRPVIVGLNANYCASSPQVPLTASIAGGTWSGAGVINTGSGYVFRPSLVGAGSYLITYTVTQSGCTHDTSQIVTVDPLPSVSITGNNPTYCTFDGVDTFTGTPAGGTWSGPGINPLTGVFNPALVSVPNNTSTVVTIRYRLTGGGTGCSDSASVNITVYKSLPVTVTASADTTCQGGAIVLTPSYPAQPIANNIRWFDVNGTFITNSLNPITVHPTRPNHGYVAVISSLQGCSSRDTITLHVNQPPVAVDDYDSTCLNTPFTFDVTANDTDPEHNGSRVRVLAVKYGSATVVANNVVYTPVYGYHGLDTLTYQICNTNCTADCDTGLAFLYICPQNLPPTADTIRYTAFQNAPHDVNVLLATSDPNGDPLNISIVGTYSPTLTVVQTSNGAYTVTGTTVGTYPIVYQVCDTDQYPVHVLCDTAVIFANIITNNTLVNHPPVANNDYATTTGIQPAIVNVRGNDTDPDGNPLTIPALNGSGVTAHGHFTVNAVDGSIIFQPNTGLAQGIYYDTVGYCISDITTVAPQPLSSCALLIVTINEIDVPANRPPVAVDDHVSVAQGTPVNVNVKGNDSDPDGDPLGTPAILTATTAGTITSVSSNGTVVYIPNPGVHSINNQPIDSFTYRVCDTLSINPPIGLCDTANVYVFVNPANLPPTADTVRYTQLVGTPHDVNVLLAVSDPNADPLTITIIGTPSPTLNIVRTGNGGYTITGSVPGTYTIQYQVCDTDQYPVHVLCATSVIVATIVPDTNTPRPPVANNDYATTTGTPAVVNARGNDSDPQGNPLTTPVLISSTTTGHGTWSVDGSGNVVFTPNTGMPAGIYYDTVRYQVCDAVYPALCAQALVIVTTNLVDTPIANRPPLAVDDHLTVPQGAVNAVVNVKGNDSDPDGDPLGTPTIIVPVHNGTVTSVSSNGDVTYTPVAYLHSINGQPVDSFVYVICDTLSAHAPAPKCDTATAYINVAGQNLPPVANNIYVSTPENTPLGVNVASGAYDPNGDPLTYTYPAGTTTTQGGTVVTTGNGSVNYFPPTGFTGVDSFQYSVCDYSPYVVHVLCDSAWVVVNVTNPGDTFANHPPVASNDYGVTVPGASINVNVIANDSDPDGNPIRVTTVSATSLGGTATIGLNNTVDYTAPATVADSIVVDTFSYVICDSSSRPVYSLCDTALVFVTINKYDTPTIHTNRPPVAVDDFSHICQDEYSFINVLNNDIDPNGDVLTVTSIVTPPAHGIAAVSSPSIAYIPAQYFFGQDSLQYRVCDSRTPALCDTAWVHYTVNLINHRPLAAQDTTSTNMNTSVNIAVTVNDYEPDHDSTTLAIVTPPVHGTVVQVANTYTYTPTPGYAGDDTFYYRVCDVQNPTATYCSAYVPLCNVGMVSIHVLHHPPHIPPTYDTIPQNSPPVTICPLVSDTDHNSVKVTSFPCGPYHGTAGFATSDSCLTYVPATDFVGNDSFCVVVCDNVVPTLCDTDYVHITVTPQCIPPVAVADTFTVFHLVSGAVLNVIANDTNHTTSALSVSIISAPTSGIAFVSGSTIRYTPTVTSGTDHFTYAICSVNPVCTSCDTGTVFVNITGTTTTPPVAVNDSVRIPQDSSVCVAVMTNDHPGSNPIHVTTACAPAHGTNSITAGGVICYVPAHGFFGVDSFCYTICDNGAPQLCSTATVIVTVTPNPHPPVAVNDYATVAQNTAVNINVPANDSDPEGNLNTGSVTLVTMPAHGAVTNINPVTGVVTYVSAGSYLGVDSFKYSICDNTPVSLGGPLCATAMVYINVTPLNHPPHAPDTTVTIPQDSFILVCAAATDVDPAQLLTTTSICTPAHGSAVITLGSTCVTYTPAPGYSGTDSFCYVVCDNGAPGLCDTGVITVIVTPVPHCPTAIKDILNATATVPVVINELGNDRNVGTIGAGYSVSILSGPDAGNTAVLNANGTITYTAAAGYTGIDHIRYFVYDSVDHCGDSAQILIYVGTSCVGPVAFDDAATVCEGAIVSTNVLANDYLGNNNTAPTVTVIGMGSHGLGYINTTTGLVEYAAPNLYHGPDTVTYQVCTSCPSGPQCDTGIVAINILITNHAPVAVDDTATMIEDHTDTINVVSNDYDVDGDPLTVSISAQPANGTLRVAGNKLIYTPNANYCGTDTFGYQITGLNGSPACPGQRAWDLGLVFVNITCVPDTPVIPDTLVHVPEDSIITVCIPYKDPDVGDHHTATVLCQPTHGTWVSVPTASDTPQTVCLTYKPDSNYHGIDSACIVICDNTTPTPLCDTSHVTIIVDPRNEPPVVQDQYVSTPENTPVGVNISTGASDPNGDPLTYSYPAGSGPDHGTWTPDSHNNGTGIYTPNTGYLGGDTFTVVVCDRSPYFVNVLCDTATVYVNVYDTAGVPNHAPVANNDYAVTDTAQAILVYVAANDLDPDGDQLTIPHIIPGTTAGGHGVIGYNAANQVVFTPVGPFSSPITVDSFQYSICDTLAAHAPAPLCDTAWAYITINYVDTTVHHNLPPVAVDDYATTQYGHSVIIPVLHNDSDPNGDPIHVTTTTLPGDSVAHAGTVTVNANGTITYAPFTGPGRGPNANHPDTFYYVICDTSAYLPHSLCDTARVVVTVPNSVQAVNDTTLTGNTVAVTVNVKANDYDPELDSFYVVGTVTGAGPHHGTAVLTDTVRGIYTYTPDGTTCSATGGIVDSFAYAVRDTLGAMDTAWVYVRVKCCSVVANDDTFSIYQGDTLLAGILVNDGLDPTIPHHITFANTTNLHGTLTVVGDSVVFRPDSGYCGTSFFTYVVSDTCGRDTANVSIHITCANIHPPTLVNDVISLCKGTDSLINVLANDYDIDSNAIAIDTFSQGSHGSVVRSGTGLLYTPVAGYMGLDTLTYRACDNGVPVLCSTAFVYIDIHKCSPPIIVDTTVHDTVLACSVNNTICIDSIYMGAGYTVHFAGFCDSSDHGLTVISTIDSTTGLYGRLCITYTPDCDSTVSGTGYVGNDTICLVICSNGVDTSCTNVHVIITVVPKPPVDSVWANNDVAYTCVNPVTIPVLANDGFAPNPGNPLTGTAIHIVLAGDSAGKAPALGTVAIVGNDIVYTPNLSEEGTDTFRYLIADNGNPQQFATATVYVYVCQLPPIHTVDDNASCTDTSALVNTPGIIHVIENDTLIPATDTVMAIVTAPQHGQVVINADFTITYTPDTGFHGNDHLEYSICESVTGSTKPTCDTASVCINVVDTITPCFFPNGFSPNGDGVNDVFTFPCAEKFPNATIKIFNRWGDVVYESVGPYKNDWSGNNMQGNTLPDGTYYFIYQYNDGSGKSEARFVVLHRN